MRRHIERLALLCACVCMAATGCLPALTEIEVKQDTTPPLEHAASSDGITLTHGNAMVVTLMPFNEEGEQEDGQISISLLDEPDPGLVLDVIERVYDYGAGTTQFVLVGESPGSGTLSVTATETKGAVEIPYTVLAQ